MSHCPDIEDLDLRVNCSVDPIHDDEEGPPWDEMGDYDLESDDDEDEEGE